MDLELKGKSVIITGGASNIGRAITLGFALEGANITIAELDVAVGERVAALARQKGASHAQVIKTDVTDLNQVKAMMESVKNNYHGIDVLVNNVGWDKLMYFSQTTPDFWEKIIQINYIGVLNCTHTVLKEMVAQGGGSIVSISSDASRQGEPREAVYGGIKAAINSFMKTVAKENGRFGVRCNVVCPGVVMPDEDEEVSLNSMWAIKGAMFSDEQIPKIAASLPLKRIGHPNDIAKAVLFMASNATAGYVTGQVLSVSGGYSMIG